MTLGMEFKPRPPGSEPDWEKEVRPSKDPEPAPVPPKDSPERKKKKDDDDPAAPKTSPIEK